AVTTAIILIGRTLIRYEVFKPLADLNAELIVKNTELLEASRLKSQFLANMTHELRTPLNSIIGYTDMINAGAYGELNERQADRMQRANRNGLLLLGLINAVLDLSKIEAGRLELARGRVAISPLVEAVCVEVEPRAAAKGLRLVRRVPRDLPPIWADEMRVFQILEKLLANAVNFTDAGEITVSGAFDWAQNEVVLSVADTGSGVEPSQRAHIFEAFMPGNARQVDPRKGPGLGLAIAHRLAVLHGGRLWYDTVLGDGSTFYVALPAVANKTATAEHAPAWRQERRV
ncbi:MAG: HAMP domain-containing histidine kinase, partial [Anaerolineae bacterium]|nr:HAMP domain-containing histidine kinase [Anaerolineae bacterium]